MNDRQRPHLRALLVEASRGLFAAHGVEVAEVPGAPWRAPGEHAAAVLGFAGSKIRGRLVLIVPYPLLLGVHPLRGAVSPLPEQDLREWISELVNQLLGLLKRELLARDVDFQLGLPTCLIAADLERVYKPRTGTLTLVLGDAATQALVLLEARLAGDADLGAPPAPAPPAVQHGADLWFE